MSIPSLMYRLRPPLPRTLASWLGRPTRAVAFWAAIALPVVYLPLFTVDVDWLPAWTVFALLALNILALVVGHSYGQ